MRLAKHFRVTTLRGDVFEVFWKPQGLEAFHNGELIGQAGPDDWILDALESEESPK